jgi:hypothetical protein
MRNMANIRLAFLQEQDQKRGGEVLVSEGEGQGQGQCEISPNVARYGLGWAHQGLRSQCGIIVMPRGRPFCFCTCDARAEQNNGSE